MLPFHGRTRSGVRGPNGLRRGRRDPESRALAGRLLAMALVWAIAGCGGGGSGGGSPPPPVPPSLVAAALSSVSPFVAGCDGVVPTGTLYENAEVEPSVAVNPINPANIVAAWQQDRWSDGGAHGLVTAVSFDTGRTWARATPAVSRCAGGSAATGADYERASDPWVTFAPDGTAYLLSLSFSGATLASGSASAMLVTRSTDGGASWSAPVALIADGSSFFNDKGSITADPADARYIYALWDRLTSGNAGPTYFARSSDSGATWAAARSIYDPGAGNQTIGNILVGLPGGMLLVAFTELDAAATATTGTLKVIRSTDHGDTWGAPIVVSPEHPAGTHDPASGAAVRDGSDLPSIAIDRSGVIYIVWQESSVSAGQQDGIALSRSLDGGLTWTTPVRVNGSPTAPAFIPSVRVRDDGVVGVTYYDFRNNTGAPGQLTTDYWLATSVDAMTWSDTHVKGPFSLLSAPVAEGLFLGDYQALGASGSGFVPVFVTTTGDPANATDVFDAFGPAQASAAAAGPVVVNRARATATSRGADGSAVPARLAHGLLSRH
jgi:hypothetical protein